MRRSSRLLHVAVLALASAALLLSDAPAARAQGTEYNYISGDPRGPENWGNIKPAWANCSAGKMQSPIDISDLRVKLMRQLGKLNTSYRAAQATIVNRGHDIEVRFDADAGSLSINGTKYSLKQVHWHTPTEHSVNGRRYDMELHMVHQTDMNKTAVVGILYQVGEPDPFLRKLEPFLLKLIANKKNKEEPVGLVDPSEARGRNIVYYRYMGSFTTPPCTEGVVWSVFKMVRTVSTYQLQLLKAAVDPGYQNNARPRQPLNNRNVGLFQPLLLGKQY